MNKDAIISVMEDYLRSKKTDYALMINGEWGSGKTYFIKNTLFPKIKGTETDNIHLSIRERVLTPCASNKKKFYNPVYISLYGLSAIDDIYSRIISSIFPILENKILLFAKAGIKTFVASKGISFDNLKEIRRFEGISIRDVLFFDDLERIDKNKIDIQSVLGYINYLSEHNHYKVIVVANDDALGDDYKQFKEKTIRFSYNHKPNLNEVYDSI